MASQLTKNNLLSSKKLFQKAYQLNKPLAILGIASLFLLAITIVGLFADPRTVINEPVWRKPAKFAASISVYAFTLIWILSLLQGHKRLKNVVAWGSTLGLFIELVIIFGQAGRGVRSHFNNTTLFDSVLFVVMGVAILLVWLVGVALTIALIRQKSAESPLITAVRWGMVILSLGALIGSLMTRPSKTQMETMRETQAATQFVGAHAVGVEDGGVGLPVVGWSLEGGDLRIAHFIGLHAMQALPLLAWAILRRYADLAMQTKQRLIHIAGISYASVTVLLVWQALRGLPIIQFDTALLLGWGALLIFIATMVSFTLRQDRSTLQMVGSR